MTPEYVSWNGRITSPDLEGGTLAELLTAHYIYQRVQYCGGQVLNLAEHLAVVRRVFWNIHRTQPEFDQTAIAADIASLVRENRYPEGVAVVVMLCFFPEGEGARRLIMCERPLIEKGYTVSSLRPSAVTHQYKMPYEGFPTNFLLSAARFYDSAALEFGATKSVRYEGGALLGCGDAPLFGIRGKTLFTAPLTDGAAESVERQLVISAARRLGLDFLEEAIPHGDLVMFDELFYADAAGITSLGECDGIKFMSLIVNRLAGHLNQK